MLELSRCLSSPLLLVSGEISETTRVMLTFKLGYAKKVFGTMEIPSGCGLFLYESTYLILVLEIFTKILSVDSDINI